MLWPFWTQKTSDEESAVRSVDAAAIIRRARRLRFSARPSALSMLSGAYHGARPGSGLTFAELRAYEPGDDVRHLDWNVTARPSLVMRGAMTSRRRTGFGVWVMVFALIA